MYFTRELVIHYTKFKGGVITVLDGTGKPVQVPANALNASLGQSTSAIAAGRSSLLISY